MAAHPDSLLVRITDFLATPCPTLGSVLGLIPNRHVVMENTLYGKEQSGRPDEWETYDLKPTSYFFPERDVAGGTLASEAMKSRLADDFPDKIRVTKAQHDELQSSLFRDTELLKNANAVDYSLFLVRFPASIDAEYLEGRANQWRTGTESFDRKWRYRAVLLDFFWAKHKVQAKAMDTVIQTYNVVGRHGPMSVTTTPEEYRTRFMKMVGDLVEVREEL
ncbi:MAG: hypothetical protein MMC23_009912 [Stictis urceolatum]|nr:hypothetical protein [Stictis urceolata]